MQCIFLSWLAAVLVAAPGVAAEATRTAAPDDLPRYEVRRVAASVHIDGKLDEPAWFAAPSIGPFHFPWYEQGAQEQTVAKMLWDDRYLYVAHVCEDAHLTARHKGHDDPIAEDDCFEIMLAPDPRAGNRYFNIEWNVHGGYIDGHRPAGPTGPRADWDVAGLQIAGTYVGTPNDDSDEDQCWIVEVAIPLQNFADFMPHMPPQPGDQWRVNLNRHGGDVNLQYSQWSAGDSPQPAFHAPHRFGVITFSNRESPF